MERVLCRLTNLICICLFGIFLFWDDSIIVNASEVSRVSLVRQQYEEYEARFASINYVEDIEKQGFGIMEGQVFTEVFESFGEEPLTFMAALDNTYNRLAIFLAKEDGTIVYKCNQLETNNRVTGQMEQNTKEIAAVSFVDLNMDEQKDIILITKCMNEDGEYEGRLYKIGDVLFQREGSFYRDYRISDKINRFGMNKSAKCIVSFVRDGQSAEFLYTATTHEELFENNFEEIPEQCYYREFEKLGKLLVLPGVFHMGDYDVFMIYLINTQGNIVWSFQPMGDYDNLYSLRGMSGKDVDGDGMKDLVVLARYSYENDAGEIVIESACSIYYQRTGGFDMDTEFVQQFKCTDELTMSDLINEIRAYWGWETEEVKEYLLEKSTKENDKSTDRR